MGQGAFRIIDLSRIRRQLCLWHEELPGIKPMFAIKANSDPQILRTIVEAGPDTAGFDCASVAEIRMVAEAGAATRQSVIFANPCKSEPEITAAIAMGVTLTTADSVSEIEKLAQCGFRGAVLVRLLVDDASSRIPFGTKFGAPLWAVPEIVAAAQKHGILCWGVSFHVGSGARLGSQYANSLRDSRVAFDILANYGFMPRIVDIGGGFSGVDDALFRDHAAAIRAARKCHFDDTVRFIAEPGRFMCTAATSLYVRVIGDRPTRKAEEIREGRQRVVVNESVYGMFSGNVYDAAPPPQFNAISFADDTAGTERLLLPTTVFGHTCDSLDTITETALLPQLSIGDWLVVKHIGAYSNVSASRFNGFDIAKPVYIDSCEAQLH